MLLTSHLLVCGSWALLGASAVAAPVWAGRHRDFTDLQDASRSIFHASEPEGGLTDRFPGEQATSGEKAGPQ